MNKVKLGDICTVVSGSTPKSGVAEYWNGNIKWITPAEISTDSYIIYDTERHITEQAVAKTNLTLLPVGTVLLSSRAPIGKTAITGSEMYCNQGFKNLICSERIYNKYLYFFLNSRVEHLNALGRGATFKEISKGIVEEVEIPLPTLGEQKYIVEQFEAIQQLIANRKQALSILDSLVKSRFVEIFGDNMENPHKFPIESLDVHADIVSGITKGRKTKETIFTEVPYMAVSNVKDGYIDWTTIKTILATSSEIEQYRLQVNDVLMTEGGDPDKLGRGALLTRVPENCIHQNHIFRVRLDGQVNPVYFEEYLQTPRPKRYFLKAAKQTTGIASINMSQLRQMPLILPPMELQNQFADFVALTDKSKLAVQQSIDTLQTLKDKLMQDYFG